MAQEKGYILSNKYMNVTENVAIPIYKDILNLKLDNGITHLSKEKGHRTQMSAILKAMYKELIPEFDEYVKPYKPQLKQIADWDYNYNNFHYPELIYASFLASKGEVVLLRTDFQDESTTSEELKNLESFLLTLPDDFSLLSDEQLKNITKINENLQEKPLYEVTLCGKTFDENQNLDKKDLTRMLKEEQELRFNSSKGKNR